ncbi:hypothetical protein LO762_24670 [Actinocorallia sp. API 0066]|uniref:hypothetical protein n=1 Tax=Actinocorallia sp. API 0066 TaxID=2896846 RepID=UPI001E3DD3CD|nr:hypothetical protein [Actinocorallia sp. API 0066]MCD0452360.1 hypothetical protein [Actinocorallia sp. API 0066]
MTSPGPHSAFGAPPHGLGRTALVLGALGLLTFWMCGLGMLLALAGIGWGVAAVTRRQGRGFGYAGIALSLTALAVASAALVWFGRQAADCSGRYQSSFERSTCLDARFPLLKAHRVGAAGAGR